MVIAVTQVTRLPSPISEKLLKLRRVVLDEERSTEARFAPSRLILSLMFVVVVAAVCIRSAIVGAEAGSIPGLGSRAWASHPDVLRSEIMLGVAQAASQRTAISPATAEKVRALSKSAPLAAEPFSVEGAIALRRGKGGEAERLLLQARQRDPRDRGVRLLLADLYLAQQKVVPGLRELVVLTALSPGAAPSVTAMLASYARAPGAVPRLRRALAPSPGIKSALLSKLAENPANVGLVLSLAGPVRPSGDLADWQRKLLASLVSAGEFRNAGDLSRQFTGSGDHELGDFSDKGPGSPFAWTLLSSAEGEATATPQGVGLDYFGRKDISLASRVIVLEPGPYVLRYRITGSAADPSSLHWVVTCLSGGSSTQLVNVPLAKPSSLAFAVPFQVPGGCDAQRIELKGLAAVYPTEVDVSIAGLEVSRR